MKVWRRLPQEGNNHDFFFSGTIYVSQGVNNELSPAEILSLYWDLQEFVKENDGISDVQVYVDENNRWLYFIDNLSRLMIESGEFEPEDNRCTLLFSDEY